MVATAPPRPIRIGATNITGLGAVQLVGSLLPALERLPGYIIETVYLPDSGPLSRFEPAAAATRTRQYRRWLPQGLSRLAECRLPSRFYAGTTPLLTLGDVPIRTAARQIVFVHNPHLVDGGRPSVRHAVARRVFRANLAFAGGFVVQTGAMRTALVAHYAVDAERVHVVPQPPPEWLLASGLRRTGRRRAGGLSLFYPAAAYPHKNHALLARVDSAASWHGTIDEIVLTLDPRQNPVPGLALVECAGRLTGAGVVERYATADALLFMSRAESFGFPLVEAMTVGLPIVCPDLPYARALCGDGAIYFTDDDGDSLCAAIEKLRDRLASGWWPDWSRQLEAIPPDWDSVAASLATLLYS